MSRTFFALLCTAPAFACEAPPPPAAEATHAGPAPTEPPATAEPTRPSPCTEVWLAAVEAEFPVSDSEGHGPDIGSAEWMHALARKQGLTGLPEAGSKGWCERVDAALFPR